MSITGPALHSALRPLAPRSAAGRRNHPHDRAADRVCPRHCDRQTPRIAVSKTILVVVNINIWGWRRGREQRGEGYLVEDAAVLKQAVDMPVIGVGGINSLDYVQSVLTQAKVDFVAVGRAILENPQWPVCA